MSAAAEAKSCMSHDTTETLQPTLTQRPGTQSLSHKDDHALLPASRLHPPSGRRPAALHTLHGLSQTHTLLFFLTHPSPLLRCSNTHPPGWREDFPSPAPGFQGWSASATPLSPPSTVRSRPEAASEESFPKRPTTTSSDGC